jgi:HEAT repeat protein
VAAAAIEALGDVDDPAIEQLLERALQGQRTALSLAAAAALGRRMTESAVQMLAWAARVSEPALLAPVAADGLRRIAASPADSAPAAVAALVALAADPARRESVVTIVATLPPDLIGLLEHELRSSRPDVRAALIAAIARMRHPDATQALVRALGDEHPAVRAAAIVAVGRLGSPAAATAIAALASADPDPAVRRRATSVCRRYGWRGDDSGRGGR